MSTPATEQAAFLRALADHLDAHPDLAPVNVMSTALQLRSGHGIAELLAWARSLDEVDHVRVSLLDEPVRPFVHVHGALAGHHIEVWGVPEGLDSAVFAHDERISLDELVSRVGGAR